MFGVKGAVGVVGAVMVQFRIKGVFSLSVRDVFFRGCNKNYRGNEMKLKIYFYSFCALAISGGVGKMAHEAIGTEGILQLVGVQIPIKTKKVEVEKIVEVEKPRAKFAQALEDRLKTSNVPRVLVEGVLMQEDESRSERMSLTRYEQSYLDRAKKYTGNPDEQRLWASSWCPFQIMAPWVKEFQLDDWSDLLDPETCVHVGMSILERCWKESKGRTKLDRVYSLGLCYNGPQGQRYAERLQTHVSRAALNQVLQ